MELTPRPTLWRGENVSDRADLGLEYFGHPQPVFQWRIQWIINLIVLDRADHVGSWSLSRNQVDPSTEPCAPGWVTLEPPSELSDGEHARPETRVGCDKFPEVFARHREYHVPAAERARIGAPARVRRQVKSES